MTKQYETRDTVCDELLDKLSPVLEQEKGIPMAAFNSGRAARMQAQYSSLLERSA